VTQEIDIRTIDPNTGSCPEADCSPYVYDAGTLFFDLMDARTNQLVWRGWAEGSLEGVVDNQVLLERRIDEAVSQIFQELPRGR
jgi:hypothetical protein